MRKFSQNSRNKLKGVHPLLVASLELALQTSPHDFAIVQGVRTQEEQNALYEQGRTKPGPIVTWTRNSNHLVKKDGYGHAIDFAAFVDGKISWDEKYYTPIADAIIKAGKQAGVTLESGAYWKNKDWGHIEIREIG
jgi:peptidoglycan L-alanyl-D-glutamate endopeptidase CwlK